MGAINKLGTQIRLPDGRVGTVVFNSLIGVGVKWGLHDPDPDDFKGTTGGLFRETAPQDWPWEPDALLRDPWPGSEDTQLECVGKKYEITRIGLAGE